MSSVYNILHRYNAILRRLRMSDASYQEIESFLLDESNKRNIPMNIAERTFKRDREDLLETFGIDIVYSTKTKKYHLEDEDALNSKFRLLDAVEAAVLLRNEEVLRPYIYPENRKPIGSHHFFGLLHAIQNKLVTELTYYKIEDDIETQRMLEPLALKEAMGYWYLLATDRKDNRIKTFAVDRIVQMHPTKKHFKRPIVNIEKMFANSFGIMILEEGEPPLIQLEFSWQQAQYVKHFPLHASQKVVSENETVAVISLQLHPTYDFLQKLLSYGPEVKVLEPASVRKTIMEYLNNALIQYIKK